MAEKYKSWLHLPELGELHRYCPYFYGIIRASSFKQFEGVDFSPLLKNPEKSVRDNIYAEDHWHDYEDFGRAIRTMEYKYIRNFYTDLANTPSADAFVGGTFASMRKLKKENALTESQLNCFIIPRPSEELYNLKDDPYELKNLASNPDYKEILTSLRNELATIRELSKDKLPSHRTPDEFNRETGLQNEFRKRPRDSKAEMEKHY